MRWQPIVSGILYYAGLLAFIVAMAVVAYAQLAPVEGLQDLGRIVLAMLAIAVGGALMGASLLASWGLKLRPSGWRLAIATFGCILAAIIAFGLLGTALPANVGLAVFAALIVLLAAGGIVASARLWRGGPMVS